MHQRRAHSIVAPVAVEAAKAGGYARGARPQADQVGAGAQECHVEPYEDPGGQDRCARQPQALAGRKLEHPLPPPLQQLPLLSCKSSPPLLRLGLPCSALSTYLSGLVSKTGPSCLTESCSLGSPAGCKGDTRQVLSSVLLARPVSFDTPCIARHTRCKLANSDNPAKRRFAICRARHLMTAEAEVEYKGGSGNKAVVGSPHFVTPIFGCYRRNDRAASQTKLGRARNG